MNLCTDVVNSGSWYQKFSFPGGLDVGSWDTEARLTPLFENINLKNKKCLDIGCLEGAGALFLEQRGANPVDCIDIYPNIEDKFNLVKKYLNLKASFKYLSVYDLDTPKEYDIVLFAGVYYHLRHPLLGIEKAWDATKEVLAIEGEIGGENLYSASASFYKDTYKGDSSNWWVPTTTCLKHWCESLDGVSKIEMIYPLVSTCRAGVLVYR